MKRNTSLHTVTIYGRSRFKFAKLFPDAVFLGYEDNIRHALFEMAGNNIDIVEKCNDNKIKVRYIETL